MCFFFQDAIRIMRRQRPGSVERKIQEETVAIFGRLLFEYGKSIMEEIERKERELRQLMKNEMEQVGMIYFDKGVIWLIQKISKWEKRKAKSKTKNE